jgi:hypothetical protein
MFGEFMVVFFEEADFIGEFMLALLELDLGDD